MPGSFLLRGPCRPIAIRLGQRALEADDPNRLREDVVWIQVAREGTYKGHSSGEFTLDKAALEQMVANCRNHPSYELAEDGYGCCDIIPFDFHHESERSGASIATHGAPAQAWAQDLEIRAGADGTLDLWALCRYLEPAGTYVREKRYQWTSIAAWSEAVDPISGENVGWYISSIAFTNDPFIQGMEPIAAERTHFARPLLLEEELDVDDIMRELRWIFGLPETAGAAEATAELAKLEAMVVADEAPAGVDVGHLISRIRDLLRLPLLTQADDVTAQLRKLIERLAAATVPADQPAPAPAATPSATITTSQKPPETKEPQMDYEKLFKAILELASKRGWRVLESELSQKLEMELEASQLAQNVIASLAEMLGIDGSNAQAVLDEISKRSAELEKVKGMLPQLQELLGEQVKAEDEMVETDVEDAMEAHRMPDSAKVALRTMRTGGISLEVQVDDRDPVPGLVKLSQAVASRRKQRDTFHASYPQIHPDKRHLTQSLVTTPDQSAAGVRQLSGARAGAAGPARPVLPPAPLGSGISAAQGNNAPWALYPGGTEQLRAMAFIRETMPAAKAMSHQEIWVQACALVRQHQGEALH